MGEWHQKVRFGVLIGLGFWASACQFLGAQNGAVPSLRFLNSSGVLIKASALTDQAKSLLNAKCASCHANGAVSGNFGIVNDPVQMVVKGYVVPGNPSGSRLYTRMADNSMPPGGPTAQDLKTIFDWITTEITIAANGTLPPGGTPASTPTPVPAPPGSSPRTQNALNLLNLRCASCHSATSPDSVSGGITYILDMNALVQNQLVAPGNPSGSRLYQSVLPTGTMPQNGTKLNSSELDLINSWILNDFGAIPTPAPLVGTFTSVHSTIIKPRCTICHKHDSYLTYSGVREDVVPGNADESEFYRECSDGTMPPRGYTKLNATELKALADWINGGALNN